MPRFLWLKAEGTPDFDAIVHPATADQVMLALEFLEASPSERQESACRLQSRLDQLRGTPPESRHAIPCRRPLGLMVLLPWRLAAWLARVMDSSAETVNDVQARLSRWLSGQFEAQTGGDENKHAVAQPSLLG